MEHLRRAFAAKAVEFRDVLKMGRTQLQDAVPMTLGQEFSTYAVMLQEDQARLRETLSLLSEINLGATAIGTGITAHPAYAELVRQHLAQISGIALSTSINLVEATQDCGCFVQISGVLKRVATKVSKICNDLRLLSSGPRTGLGEINLPPRQAGSSIMPGKVNPVIPEVVNQIAFEVIGNDVTVSFAAEGGQLQLNAFEPIIAHSLFKSVQHLAAGCRVLADKCVDGITANVEHLRQNVENSIGIVTALNPYIGYANATAVAQDALATGASITELVLARGLLTAEQLSAILRPEVLTQPIPPLHFHASEGTPATESSTRKHIMSSHAVASPSITLSACGQDILNNPLLNKSTAFTLEERDNFGLHGLLPPQIESLEEQIARRLECVRALPGELERYVFLRDLQDTNETLYFALLTRHLEELLPVIYTPTVGAACQRYSQIYRRPRGLYLSLPNQARLDQIFASPRFDRIECIVVTDGERILGLGDQGAGGMGIPVGKLAIYSACGGIDPATTLPITLDVGTNNAALLADPMYIGWRHERVRGQDYDDFIEAFVTAVSKRWPNILLQWEDFHKNNANRLLERYRNRLCTFNDDIQGTAAVATGTLLAAIKKTGVPLSQQRIAILGGGSAGIGIAAQIKLAMIEQGLSAAEASTRFYVLGRNGLVTDQTPGLESFQQGFVQPCSTLTSWSLSSPGQISLLDVVHNAHPTVLIGVSGQAGGFSETVIREMARHVARPIIFPLSNPTSCVEARPDEIIRWTDGQAIIGTGSPFPAFEYAGKQHHFAQTNNSYIFPGVGLGVLASQARRITDSMFLAAAKALAELSPANADADARLLPELARMREVSISIALAVAQQARAEGLTAAFSDAELLNAIHAKVWVPQYRRYQR